MAKQPNQQRGPMAGTDEPTSTPNTPPPKPSEREGRPEAPRKDDTAKPGTDPDGSSQSGHALPERDKPEPGNQRDTLHIPSRIDRQ